VDVLVSSEHRFDRTPDGRVWTQSLYAYSFWTRYLAVFDRVRVLARVRDIPTAQSDWQRADGQAVSLAAVPYFLGPKQYLMRLRRVRRAARSAVNRSDAVILRLSSPIAATIVPLMRRTGHPYGVEVVGDPYDVFAPGAVHHPLRPFCRWWFPRQLRRQCAAACAAAYVTDYALQRRYPPALDVLSTSYSSVELPNAAFAPTSRPIREAPRAFTLVTIGSLEQMYKAPDVLIDAVSHCVRQGLDLSLILIGDGKHRPEMEARATAAGLGERVCFRGQITAGSAVRTQLDQSDLFVLPSRTEGLPRAMIEAMARALPCIGTRIGGIPELLPSDDLVPPNDVAALAQKIRDVLTDPARMARMSASNLEHARGYHEDVLSTRRSEFYRYVQERTEAWLKHS